MTLQRLLTAALGCCAVEKKQWISICVSFDFQAFVFPSQDTRKFSQPVNDLFIIYHRFSKLVFPFHSSRCVTTQSDLQRYRTASLQRVNRLSSDCVSSWGPVLTCSSTACSASQPVTAGTGSSPPCYPEISGRTWMDGYITIIWANHPIKNKINVPIKHVKLGWISKLKGMKLK